MPSWTAMWSGMAFLLRATLSAPVLLSATLSAPVLLSATLSAPAATAPPVDRISQVVQVVPGSVPQSFTLDCAPGSQLVGGGYDAGELRVIAGYPRSTTSWVVEVWNVGTLPAQLRLSAVCLRDTDQVTLHSVSGATRVTSACPEGTVVTGGGFRPAWSARGGPLVTGSRPAGNGWAVTAAVPPADGAPLPTQLTAHTLCLSGARSRIVVASMLSVPPGPPNCSTAPVTAVICTYPRVAARQIACPAGESRSMTGHRLVAGTLPAYSVRASGERFAVNGISRDPGPLEFELTALCLAFPATAAPVDLTRPLLAGGGLLLLLLLLLGLVAVFRLRSRATPVAAGLDVVVRAKRSTFHLDRQREVR